MCLTDTLLSAVGNSFDIPSVSLLVRLTRLRPISREGFLLKGFQDDVER